MAFSGWPEEALDFYDGLAADNTKTYWTEHKAVYEDKILRPMTELTEELAEEFGEPKIFRPYRDVRFSRDKTPYKTHIGAVIGGTGYVQLSAEGLGAGAGMWQMSPEQLARYRAAVADDIPGSELEQIIAADREGRGSPCTATARSSPRRAATRPTTPGSALLRYKGVTAGSNGRWSPGWKPRRPRTVSFLFSERPSRSAPGLPSTPAGEDADRGACRAACGVR